MTDLHPFYHFLKSRSSEKLPGKTAHLKLQPEPLDENFRMPPSESENGHPSSVLIPMFQDRENQLNVILTLRTDSIRHAGQISFPGGRSDMGESLQETALRETREEVGISPEMVQIACSITPLYLFRSNNRITPYVGFLSGIPELKPNPAEVEEAFSVRLDSLLDEKNLIREVWELSYATFRVPYWDVHSTPLWGATAMIMSELLELYREFLEGRGR